VKRLLSAVLVVCLLIAGIGCGNIFIRGAIQPGNSTVSGFISVVQFSTVIGGDGTMIQVTFVTFLQEGASSTIGFCGDQRSQFPMEQKVRAQFTPGQLCDSIIQITIIV
jgi:hypothetical protein